jgi:hypothetical protein
MISGLQALKPLKKNAAILLCLSFLRQYEKAQPTNRAIVSAACEGVKTTYGEIENKVPAQAELHDVP